MPSDLPVDGEAVPDMGYEPAPAAGLQKTKSAALFAGFGFVVIATAVGLMPLYVPADYLKTVQLVLFAVLGFAWQALSGSRKFIITQKQQLAYTAIAAVVLLVVLLALRLAGIAYHPLAVVANVAAFLVPSVLSSVWRSYSHSTTTEPVLWQYTPDLPMHKSTVFLNSIPIRFKVSTHNGTEETLIAFRAPVRLKLGMLFYHMVQEQNNLRNKKIELVNDGAMPYGWAFYKTGISGLNIYMNPDTTLIENGIKQNSVIIARQIDVPLQLPAPTKR